MPSAKVLSGRRADVTPPAAPIPTPTGLVPLRRPSIVTSKPPLNSKLLADQLVKTPRSLPGTPISTPDFHKSNTATKNLFADTLVIKDGGLRRSSNVGGTGVVDAVYASPSGLGVGDALSRVLANAVTLRDDEVKQRIKELRTTNMWAAQRLPKFMEPPRLKTHWDYVLDEAIWMANDFEMERKWKVAVARTLAKAIKKYHDDKALDVSRGLKSEQQRRKKVAGGVAREVGKYWRHMVQIAQFQQKLQLDAVQSLL